MSNSFSSAAVLLSAAVNAFSPAAWTLPRRSGLIQGPRPACAAAEAAPSFGAATAAAASRRAASRRANYRWR